MASSAFTDSASPGRNDDDSFFWTPSNLPAWLASPMKNTRATNEDDVLGAPAGGERQHVNRLYGARPPFGFS